LKRYFVKGSYTVEAALLLPTILIIIISLLYLSFYLHDVSKLQGIINDTILKSKMLINNETDLNTGLINYDIYMERGIFYSMNHDILQKEEQIYTYLQNKLKKGFFITRAIDIKVDAGLTNIGISVRVKMEYPFRKIQQIFDSGGTFATIQNESEVHNYTEFIRIFSVFMGVSEKVGIVHNALLKLQKLLNKLR
jgi:hypothetical protein